MMQKRRLPKKSLKMEIFDTEILIGQSTYIIMPNRLFFLKDFVFDNDEYLVISKYAFDKTDDFDQKFILDSINFYEKHKDDSNPSL